jgi:predicted DNA-binding transcriptional regulator AlpA
MGDLTARKKRLESYKRFLRSSRKRNFDPKYLKQFPGYDPASPYRLELEAQGKFPRRVKLGDRRYGYVEEELDTWLKQRAALRNAAA